MSFPAALLAQNNLNPGGISPQTIGVIVVVGVVGVILLIFGLRARSLNGDAWTALVLGSGGGAVHGVALAVWLRRWRWIRLLDAGARWALCESVRTSKLPATTRTSGCWASRRSRKPWRRAASATGPAPAGSSGARARARARCNGWWRCASTTAWRRCGFVVRVIARDQLQ